MASVPRNIRMDEDLYAAAKEVFRKLGLPTTVAVNLFFEYVVREQGIPFAVSLHTEQEQLQKALTSCPLAKKLAQSQCGSGEKEEGVS